MTRLNDTIENRAAVRKELVAIRDRLAEIAVSLDTVDHDAARSVNNARSQLFAAWSVLRNAPLEA